jgi:hypothetical protein
VQPPAAVVQQASLRREAAVEGGAWVGHEDVEGREREPVLDRPLAGGERRLRGLVVVAESERRPGLETVVADPRHRLGVPVEAGEVRALAHLGEVLGIQALEADHVPEAAALDEQAHELLVPYLVDACLGHPADAERDERAQEGLGRRHVGDQVVVHEEQVPPGLVADLRHHLLYRPRDLVVIEVRGDCAELAAVPAATPELEEGQREVSLAHEEVSPGQHARLRRSEAAVVARVEGPVVCIADHLWPE